MKKKDLIARIRESAIEEMPDIRKRINLANIAIDDAPETVKSPFNLRKAFSYTFASLFILISGVFAFNFIQITDTTPLESETEIVGFQTISAASLLDSFDLTELSLEQNTSSVMLLSDTTTVVDDDPILQQLNLINNYLNMAETVLVNQEQYMYEALESDRSEYQYAFLYHGTDLLGNLIQYQGYYNIEDNDGLPVEVGILVHNERTYHYSSVVIENGDVNIYRYRIHFNEENYVEVSNSSTDKAQRFVYRVYRNNELMNQSEVTLVQLRKRLTATVQITNRLNDVITLDIERDMTNMEQQQFKVSYQMNGGSGQSSGQFTVQLQFNEESNTYEFQYQINNREVVLDQRPDKGNKKATEDDFKPGRGGNNNPYVTTATSTDFTTETTTEATTDHGSSTTNPSGNNDTSPGPGFGGGNMPNGNQNFNSDVEDTLASTSTI